MSLYPKYGVYKILLEISGLKKSVVISDLSLKPMSLNPKFTVLEGERISYNISPDIFSHFSSLQEIHLKTEDPYSVLPYIQSFSNLTYLGIEPTVFSPVYKPYGHILKRIINKNTNTLRGIKLYYLFSIGINSWDSILAPIQHCSKLIELEIGYIYTRVNNNLCDLNGMKRTN